MVMPEGPVPSSLSMLKLEAAMSVFVESDTDVVGVVSESAGKIAVTPVTPASNAKVRVPVPAVVRLLRKMTRESTTSVT